MLLAAAGMTLSGEIEASAAVFSNEFGTMTIPGGRAQLSAFLSPIEVALRYSVIALGNSGIGYNSGSTNGTIYRFLSDNRTAGNSTGNLLMNQIREVAVSGSYYFQNRIKAIVEYAVSDVSVLHENNITGATQTQVGSYSLIQHPEQSKLVATTNASQVERQIVQDIRIMLQYRF